MFNPAATKSWSVKACSRRILRLRPGPDGDVRRHQMGRGWNVLRRRDRVRIGTLGRPAGGAEPVQAREHFQTLRARLARAGALADLKPTRLTTRPKLEVKSETEYFAEQASQTSDRIQKLWAGRSQIAMAFGALAGALNTMYSSVAARAVEIRDTAGDRLRRLPGIRRYACRILDAGRDRRRCSAPQRPSSSSTA